MSFLSELKAIKVRSIDEEKFLNEKIKQEDLIDSGGDLPVFKLYEFIDCVTVNKIPWEELGPVNQKAFSNIFMINKYLSMIPDFALFLSDIQIMQKSLTPEYFYKYLFYFLPKEPFYGKYIKEKEQEKISKEVLDVLAKHFEEKLSNVSKYYKMLSNSDKISLLKKYGWDIEKINKNLKINE